MKLIDKRRRPVYQINRDKEDDIIHCFDSINVAAKVSSTYFSAIRRACDRKLKGSNHNHAGGYKWEYADIEEKDNG